MRMREKPMSDLQVTVDRVKIEAMRGEFTDAVMMCDYDPLASLFTPGGAVRNPAATSRPPAGRRSAPWRAARGSLAQLRADHAPGHAT